MEIDATFPTKLIHLSSAPEPFRSALTKSLAGEESIRLLVHSPIFTTEDEKLPATLLAITNDGWLVASEMEEGEVTIQRSDFSDTLYIELTSILLFGQIKIFFADASSSSFVAIKFETVGEDLFREAIDLIRVGMDPALVAGTNDVNDGFTSSRAWPLKIRNEAQRYWPRGQRSLAAIQWPLILDGSQQRLVPPGGLLITEHELVVITEGKDFSAESETSSAEEAEEICGETIIFVLRLRLADFQINDQENFEVLVLQISAAGGGKKLEIIFPSGEKEAVSKAMEQMLHS